MHNRTSSHQWQPEIVCFFEENGNQADIEKLKNELMELFARYVYRKYLEIEEGKREN